MTTSKILFYDLETTGVYPHQNGIHQIAGIVTVEGKVIEEFDIKLKPHPKCKIEKQALDVAGITQADLDSYQPMEDGYLKLINILDTYVDRFNKRDKMHLCGYNNRAFDDRFIRRFFEYNRNKFFGAYFWSDSMDMLALMSYTLRKKRHLMENFKLGTVCNFVGIPFNEEEAHDGLYDTRKTMELFNFMEFY